jgi:hypothetical protein
LIGIVRGKDNFCVGFSFLEGRKNNLYDVDASIKFGLFFVGEGSYIYLV